MDVHQIRLDDIACRHSLLPINAAMYREAIMFQLVIAIAMPHVVGTLSLENIMAVIEMHYKSVFVVTNIVAH